MRSKTFGLIAALILGLLVALPAAAQPGGKVPRLGVVFPAEPASPEEPNGAAFRQALRALGYVEGPTITVEYRYAHGEVERMRELVAELVGRNVDVLVAGSGPAALAAKHATQTIPIVMAGVGDPVGSGLVASLARPGGNVTGLSLFLGEEFGGKWVELLQHAEPKVSRVAYLRDPAHPGTTLYVPDLQRATHALGCSSRCLRCGSWSSWTVSSRH